MSPTLTRWQGLGSSMPPQVSTMAAPGKGSRVAGKKMTRRILAREATGTPRCHVGTKNWPIEYTWQLDKKLLSKQKLRRERVDPQWSRWLFLRCFLSLCFYALYVVTGTLLLCCYYLVCAMFVFWSCFMEMPYCTRWISEALRMPASMSGLLYIGGTFLR